MFKKYKNNIYILNRILGPYKKMTILLLLLMILVALVETISIGILLPLISQIISTNTYYGENESINSIVNFFVSRFTNVQSRIVSVSILFLLIIFIKNIFIYLKLIFEQYYIITLRKYWSESIFYKYINSDYRFILSQKRGTLINNILNETMLSSKFMGALIGLVSRSIIMVSLVSLMFVINWQVTSLVLTMICFIGICYSLITSGKSRKIGQKRLSTIQEITSESEEGLNAVRQVKLFSLEHKIVDTFSQKFEIFRKLVLRIQIIKNIPLPLGEVVITGIFTILIIYVEKNSDIAISNFIPLMGFIMYSSQKLYLHGSNIMSGRAWLVSYIPSVKLIYSILTDEIIKYENLSNGKKISSLNGDIKFNNVSFIFGEAIILDHVSPVFKKGNITAITGKSGSGKSTLVDLFSGLLKDYSGDIFINNTDIKDINISSLRNIIGYVSQDSFLFNNTIKENIALGGQNITFDEIIKVSKKAQAHDFINQQPKKYDTIVGDRGLTLSGGERQRLTIARAFARKPDILIIDEGISAIDNQMGEKILDYLVKLKNKGTTIIIISHQKHVLEIADKIYNIEKGNITSINPSL